ncbi:Ig-like domain-containing protein [Vibrio owensii]|uniref:Ig-like domain-containing protein n=1 Tax=Vibrio owensii TaxID=696485 RepID=UPI0033992574
MKKSLLATSIALLLSACGGSDGGSKPSSDLPLTDIVKPVLPEETVNELASDFGIDAETIKAVCNDVAFTCKADTRNDGSTIAESNDLIHIIKDQDGIFTDGYIKIANSNDVDLSELVEVSGTAKVVLRIGSETITHDLTGLFVGDMQNNGEFVHMALGELVDVNETDNRELLNKLVNHDGEITLKVDGSFQTKGGETHQFTYFNGVLGNEAYKAAFSILLENSTDITPEPENQAPTFELEGSLNTMVNDSNKVQINAVDPDGDPINYAVVGASFVTVDEFGLITVEPSEAHVGDHTVTVYVWDTEEASSKQEVSFKVSEIPNEAPTLEVIDSVSIPVGEISTIQVKATDPDGDKLTYSLDDYNENGPASINSETGLITIIPTEAHAGLSFEYSVGVTDGELSTGSNNFIVTVQQVEEPTPDPEPEEPTIEDLAKAMNYTGDIVLLERLFVVGSDLAWKIDENNQPVIYSVYYDDVAFYPLTSKMIVGNYAYPDEAELLDFSESKVTSLGFYADPIKDFKQVGFVVDGSKVTAHVEFTFTDLILEKFLSRSHHINFNYTAKNIITEKVVTNSINVVPYHIGETYREVLKNVLMPYAEVENPELAEFAELTETSIVDLELLKNEEFNQFDLKVENGSPVIYVSEPNSSIINRRIDLGNGTIELGFAELDYHNDINIGEIVGFKGESTYGDHIALDSTSEVNFEQTGDRSFKAVVKHELSKAMALTVTGSVYILTVNYIDSSTNNPSYVVSQIEYISYGDSNVLHALNTLLEKHSK